MTKEYPNLSAHRGNRFGIGFFKVVLACFGVRTAFFFAWFITWFYAVFDRRAFASTEAYLKLRFPGDASSPRRLRGHFHRLIFQLARILILSYGQGRGRGIPLEESGRENIAFPGGKVLVLAHFSCWQTAMPLMGTDGHADVNIMARPDHNGNMDKFLAFAGSRRFGVISTESFSGGLIEAAAALDRGETVIVMGDRAVEGAASASVPFFGGSLELPLSPWMLAARSGVPAVPVFAELEEKPFRIRVRYCEPVLFSTPAGRVRSSSLIPAMERYGKLLEEAARRRPYDFFRFGNEKNG